MTDTDFLLEVLSDGKSHDHAEILRRSFAERGCGLTVHSRASDLRKRGLVVHCALSKRNGRISSSYRLLRTPAVRDERPEVTAGVRSKVTVSPTSQGEPGSTGPDAHLPGSPAPPEQLTLEAA